MSGVQARYTCGDVRDTADAVSADHWHVRHTGPTTYDLQRKRHPHNKDKREQACKRHSKREGHRRERCGLTTIAHTSYMQVLSRSSTTSARIRRTRLLSAE